MKIHTHKEVTMNIYDANTNYYAAAEETVGDFWMALENNEETEYCLAKLQAIEDVKAGIDTRMNKLMEDFHKWSEGYTDWNSFNWHELGDFRAVIVEMYIIRSAVEDVLCGFDMKLAESPEWRAVLIEMGGAA